MCETCGQHNSRQPLLNAFLGYTAQYARQLTMTPNPRTLLLTDKLLSVDEVSPAALAALRTFFTRFERTYLGWKIPLLEFAVRLPPPLAWLRAMIQSGARLTQQGEHVGRVLSRQDIFDIFTKMPGTHVYFLPCICRGTVGNHEPFCMAIIRTGIVEQMMGDFPDFASGMKKIDNATALQILMQHRAAGMVQSAWLFGDSNILRRGLFREMPGLLGICSCDPHKGCVALAADRFTRLLIPSDEAAVIDPKVCSSCRRCVAMEECPASGQAFSKITAPVINPGFCKGCERCTVFCPQHAIRMQPRLIEPHAWVYNPARVQNTHRVTIDQSMCAGCAAPCLRACRNSVLHRIPAKARVHGQITREFAMTTISTLCDGCGKCEKKCPKHAIVVRQR